MISLSKTQKKLEKLGHSSLASFPADIRVNLFANASINEHLFLVPTSAHAHRRARTQWIHPFVFYSYVRMLANHLHPKNLPRFGLLGPRRGPCTRAHARGECVILIAAIPASRWETDLRAADEKKKRKERKKKKKQKKRKRTRA